MEELSHADPRSDGIVLLDQLGTLVTGSLDGLAADERGQVGRSARFGDSPTAVLSVGGRAVRGLLVAPVLRLVGAAC